MTALVIIGAALVSSGVAFAGGCYFGLMALRTWLDFKREDRAKEAPPGLLELAEKVRLLEEAKTAAELAKLRR